MKPWLSWTRWLNPLYYGFEAAMSNEFHDSDFECVGASLVPSGPGYTTTGGNFICSVQGSVVGENFVGGDAYVSWISLSSTRAEAPSSQAHILPCSFLLQINNALGYYYSHLGRNVNFLPSLPPSLKLD